MVDTEVVGDATRKCLAVRVGCTHAVFLRSDDLPTAIELVDRIERALLADSRVDDVRPPETLDLEELWFWKSRSEGLDEEALLAGANTEIVAPALRMPFAFTVAIPKKNQLPDGTPPSAERYFGSPPSDRYLVRWDGAFFTVAWEQDADDSIHQGGGIFVRDILLDVLRRADFSPRWQFPTVSHQIFRVVGARDSEFCVSPSEIALPLEFDAEAFATSAFLVLQEFGHVLHQMSSSYASFQTAETVIERDLQHLLTLQYERSKRTSARGFSGLKDRWRNRHWRRTARTLIARVWYAMSLASKFKSEWIDFESALAATSPSSDPLFESTVEHQRRALQPFEAPQVVHSIEHASRSLDNRDLAFATALATAIGLVVGAALTLIFG